MTEEEIRDSIDWQHKARKVIKFPNNKYLLKVIFATAEAADSAVESGLSVGYQKFAGKNINKEIFVPVIPCYRCYQYDHQKKNCLKPDDLF